MEAKKSLSTSSLILLIFLCISTQARIIRVPGDFGSIQAAISNANGGDEIWVAKGTYKPAGKDRTISFVLKNGVALYGGFVGNETSREQRNWKINETILSGDINIPYICCDNSYNVVNGSGTDKTAVLDGFTITGGYARDVYVSPACCAACQCIVSTGCSTDKTAVMDGFTITGDQAGFGSMSVSCNYRGGGMYNYYGSPTVTNCTFLENTAYNAESDDHRGGGMYNEGGSPTVTNCIFSHNLGNYGGGMCNYDCNATITDCNFSGNLVSIPPCPWPCPECPELLGPYGPSHGYGGGMYNEGGSPTITNCIFSGHGTGDEDNVRVGGGMYNYDCNATITNCTFSGNVADYTGGGMCNDDCNATITNCTFSGNVAGDGGGMSTSGNAIITNCTFTGNSVCNPFGGNCYGGGIYNEGDAIITNCIFTGNRVYSNGRIASGGGVCTGGEATITNCTFCGNSADGNNGAYGYGGGICCVGSYYEVSTTEIINCILYDDTALSGGDEIALLLHPYDYIPSTADVNYSDVNGGQGAVYVEKYGDPEYDCTLNWGPGNIDKDPCFVSPPGNLRLKADSPCIDAGDNNSVPPDYADLDNDGNTIEPTPFDLDSFDRFRDGDYNNSNIVDMGAYELQPECVKHTAPFYTVWLGSIINPNLPWSKPDCWCYRRNCRGDADGAKGLNLYWVYSQDLTILRAGYGKQDTQLTGDKICGDFMRDKQLGLYRVYTNDLTRLRTNYGKLESLVKCCDADQNCTLDAGDDFNFWTN